MYLQYFTLVNALISSPTLLHWFIFLSGSYTWLEEDDEEEADDEESCVAACIAPHKAEALVSRSIVMLKCVTLASLGVIELPFARVALIALQYSSISFFCFFTGLNLGAEELLLETLELLLGFGLSSCSMGRLLETLELLTLLTELVSLELTLLAASLLELELELLTGRRIGRSVRADAVGAAISNAVTMESGVWMRMRQSLKECDIRPQSTQQSSDASDKPSHHRKKKTGTVPVF